MSVRDQITNVLNRYALAYDLDRLEEMNQVFTDDAEMSMRIAGGDLIGPFKGRDSILQLMKDSHAQQTDQRRHVIDNVLIRAESDRGATVESYLLLFSVEDEAMRVLSSGVYTDELVREDGGWRIARRHLDLDLPY